MTVLIERWHSICVDKVVVIFPFKSFHLHEMSSVLWSLVDLLTLGLPPCHTKCSFPSLLTLVSSPRNKHVFGRRPARDKLVVSSFLLLTYIWQICNYVLELLQIKQIVAFENVPYPEV